MSKDITRLLTEWAHEDGPTARRVQGEDGREKVQIRVCIDSFNGLLQFECDGRPDGKAPHGREFYFDYLEDKRRKHLDAGSAPEAFKLTRGQCRKLFEESGMLYHRYVVLLQMGDYDRVIRDTERNMRLFRFVRSNAAHDADRSHLECWWPYILRIHHMAVVMKSLEDGNLDAALASITACRTRIEELVPQENEVFTLERTRSLEALEQMATEIRSRKPLTELEKLEKEKGEAIQGQQYEVAARLRDKINALQDRNGKG